MSVRCILPPEAVAGGRGRTGRRWRRPARYPGRRPSVARTGPRRRRRPTLGRTRRLPHAGSRERRPRRSAGGGAAGAGRSRGELGDVGRQTSGPPGAPNVAEAGVPGAKYRNPVRAGSRPPRRGQPTFTAGAFQSWSSVLNRGSRNNSMRQFSRVFRHLQRFRAFANFTPGTLGLRRRGVSLCRKRTFATQRMTRVQV